MEPSDNSFYLRGGDGRAVAFTLLTAVVAFAAFICVMLAFAPAQAEQTAQRAVYHRSIEIDGVTIAYREAGDLANPTVLYLHGFSQSPRIFKDLIPALAEKYHVLAPDLPGFGASDTPPTDEYEYSADNYAKTIERFTEKKHVKAFALYLMDYGASVGYCLFVKNPHRVSAFIIQNGDAYEANLREIWAPIKTLQRDQSQTGRTALRQLLALDAPVRDGSHSVGDAQLINIDMRQADQLQSKGPSGAEIQLNLIVEYVVNTGQHDEWMRLFRKHQPPALMLWGKSDPAFPRGGAHPRERDFMTLESHWLDAAHIAFDEYDPFIVKEILGFLDREVPRL